MRLKVDLNALRRYDPDTTLALIRRPTNYIAAFTEAAQEVSRRAYCIGVYACSWPRRRISHVLILFFFHEKSPPATGAASRAHHFRCWLLPFYLLPAGAACHPLTLSHLP